MTKLSLLFVLTIVSSLAVPQALRGQNIPPFIVDHIKRPKVRFPNPMNQAAQQGQQKGKQPSQSYGTRSQEMEIENFFAEYLAGFASNDLNKVASCYSQEPDLAVFWESRELKGWENIRPELEKLIESEASDQVPLQDLEAHIFGRFAWATGKYGIEPAAGGEPPKPDGCVTFVLEKRRSYWYIVHEHRSAGSVWQVLATENR